jgi:type VI secretion system protein ImpM
MQGAAAPARPHASGSALIFFGKVPSRGDFIRSHHAPALIQAIDRWISRGLEAMSADTRWTIVYDRAQPLRFAQLGSNTSAGMAGHLIPSRDASGRRYPLLTAAALEIPEPMPFFARSPLALARAWQALETTATAIHGATDVAPLLAGLEQAAVEVESDARAYDQIARDFLELQSVQGLESMLRAQGHPELNLRRTVLGLGLLLQPVLAQGMSRLDKGLALPLPADALHRPLVASMWLELARGFLSRADFELALFMPPTQSPAHPETPAAAMLHLGFEGSAPRTLHAMLDPAVGAEYFIDLRDAEWVDSHLDHDHGTTKLSSYLAQGHLSLAQACRTFREVFLGA